MTQKGIHIITNDKTVSLFYYLITMFVVSIDTFYYYMHFYDEPGLYIGAFTHLALLLIIDKIWAERKSERFVYYAIMICNYLLLIPKYIMGLGWRIGVNNGLWDLILSVIFVLPLFVHYRISQNTKQQTILTVNSLMVIGLANRGELIHNDGFEDWEGVGVVSALVLFTMLMVVILSVVLFYYKKRQMEYSSSISK